MRITCELHFIFIRIAILYLLYFNILLHIAHGCMMQMRLFCRSLTAMHGHVYLLHGHCTSNRKQNTSVKELETTIMSDTANHII